MVFFQKKRKDDRCNQVSEILVQASEMEATRLKKVRSFSLGISPYLRNPSGERPCSELLLGWDSHPPSFSDYLSVYFLSRMLSFFLNKGKFCI